MQARLVGIYSDLIRSTRAVYSKVTPCHMSNPVYLALFEAAALRQREKPDNTGSYLTGCIADDTLRMYLDIEDCMSIFLWSSGCMPAWMARSGDARREL